MCYRFVATFLFFLSSVSIALFLLTPVSGQSTGIDTLEGQNVTALFEKGKSLLLEGRVQEALTNIDKALSIEPNNPALLFVKAYSLSGLGRLEESRSL